MSGIRLWWWLAISLYPEEEPALPAAIHIRMAIGGSMTSVASAVAAILAALGFHSKGHHAWALLAFAALDSLLIFGIGSLIPLGFNNGSTLIYWLGEKKRQHGDWARSSGSGSACRSATPAVILASQTSTADSGIGLGKE